MDLMNGAYFFSFAMASKRPMQPFYPRMAVRCKEAPQQANDLAPNRRRALRLFTLLRRRCLRRQNGAIDHGAQLGMIGRALRGRFDEHHGDELLLGVEEVARAG